MSYIRVLPRDLFNEANFLKCLGALWIKLEGHSNAKFDQEDVDAFELDQDADGHLTVYNVTISIHGELYTFRRPLNSCEPYPLYIRKQGEWDETCVFNDDGSLHADFVRLTS